MTSHGSQQLRAFRRLVRDGATLMTASAESGLSIEEGRMTLADDEANPPPPEAYEPITPPKENDEMARGRKKADEVEVVEAPNYDLAVKIWRQDIKPAQSKVSEHAQEQSTAYKEIKNHCNIQPQAAKLAFKLDGMEESKRDDFLRSFNGLLKRLNIFMPRDMLDVMEGKEVEDVVPTGEAPRPKLATVQGQAAH